MWKPGLAWLFFFGLWDGKRLTTEGEAAVASVGMMFVSGWVEENWQRQGLAFGRAEAPSARRFIGTAEAVPLSETRFFQRPCKAPNSCRGFRRAEALRSHRKNNGNNFFRSL